MSGLTPATQALVYAFGAVSLVTLGTFLGAVLRELVRPELAAVASAGKAVLGFLERSFRDIVEGFKNGVEWLVYGA